MFKPKDEISYKSHELIHAAFNQVMGEGYKYTVVYGYFVKSGLLSKKVYNYVLGFSAADKEIVIVTIVTNGTVGDQVTLTKNTIASAKYGLQGDITIKSDAMSKPIRMFVPPYTPSNAGSTYMLPIVQEEQEKLFRAMIKGEF